MRRIYIVQQASIVKEPYRVVAIKFATVISICYHVIMESFSGFYDSSTEKLDYSL